MVQRRPEEGRRKERWKEKRKETQRTLAKAILWNPAILSGVFGDDICSDQSIRSPWQPVSLVCPPHSRSLESQSAQRMGECTRGCGTDGWLSERTREGRTVGSGILASRTGGTVLFVSPIPEQGHVRRPRGLPTYNSQFSRSICIFEPQNPGTGNIFMRFTHKTVHAVLSLVPFLARSTSAPFFVQETDRFASPGDDFICIRKRVWNSK